MNYDFPKQIGELLENYYKETGQEFYVQTHLGKHIKPWILYPSGTRKVTKQYYDGDKLQREQAVEEVGFLGNENQRQILPHEVVIDIDAKAGAKAQFHMEVISEWLCTHELTHTVWYSGGKSYHIHLFFPELLEQPPTIRTEWKKNFLKVFTAIHPVDLQKANTKTLIQLEHARHYKTLRDKFLIKTHTFGTNKFPEKLKVIARRKDIGTKAHPLSSKHSIPPCVTFLLENVLEDGRERALFILAGNLAKHHTQKEALEILKNWNEMQGYRFNDNTIHYKLWKALETRRAPGCRYVHDLLEELGHEVKCPVNLITLNKKLGTKSATTSSKSSAIFIYLCISSKTYTTISKEV